MITGEVAVNSVVYLDPDIVAIFPARRLPPSPGEEAVARVPAKCHLHKGIIDGEPWSCPCCGAIYCQPCKDELAYAGESCWSCNSPLEID